MGVVVNSQHKINSTVIPANSTVSVNVLGGNGIFLYSIYFQGQATGETDTFQIKDSNGNIYYSSTAGGLFSPLAVPSGLMLVNLASGTATPTGKVNIIYGVHL